eukprot:1158027-Pelagomonas_calceolata.AAC.10
MNGAVAGAARERDDACCAPCSPTPAMSQLSFSPHTSLARALAALPAVMVVLGSGILSLRGWRRSAREYSKVHRTMVL